MKWPVVTEVASELRDINAIDHGYEHADVRLQVYDDGQWAVRWGDSQYDYDHRGYWGVSTVPGNGRRFSSIRIARILIDEAEDMYETSR